jgi:hypothetical protein
MANYLVLLCYEVFFVMRAIQLVVQVFIKKVGKVRKIYFLEINQGRTDVYEVR